MQLMPQPSFFSYRKLVKLNARDLSKKATQLEVVLLSSESMFLVKRSRNHKNILSTKL